MKRIAALAIWIPLLWAQGDRPGLRTVTAVRHWSLNDETRVAVEVSSDFKFQTDRLHDPERVYFDILDAHPRIGHRPLYSESLDDNRVKRLRVAETTPGVTRIVLDLSGPLEVSTTQLANPDRLMIEVHSTAAPVVPTAPPGPPPADPVPHRPDLTRPDLMISPGRQVKALVAPMDLASAEMVVAEPSKNQLAQPARPEDSAKNAAADGTNSESISEDPGSVPPASPAANLPSEGGKGTRHDGTTGTSRDGSFGTSASGAITGGVGDASRLTRRDSPNGTSAGGASAGNGSSADSSRLARRDSPNGTSAGGVSATNGSSADSSRLTRRDSSVGAPVSETTVASAVDTSKVAHPDSPGAGSTATLAALAETGKPARHTAGGDSSLVRELGLKISRVVIDPGHGGHDQGTHGKTLIEKDLVLDVAMRVGKLIDERMGAEVIYTRTDDTFIPLEGRTALANEKRADLFLSIHANSSPVTRIAGMETYYLNFTDSKDAMDVAARENANAQASIFELRDMVQKITLHDKAEESKEFAGRVQSSLYALSARELPGNRNRGVKKAPFVVLIGAKMPSVLAEIGFLSNPREESLLKKPEYRQKLAEALYRGVQRYADSLSHFQVAQTRSRP